MNVVRGRARRPDDWPSSHARARTHLAERFDGPIGAAEESWLAAHLDACADCRTIGSEYAAQRLELRALRDRMPPPPRDLWARTSAAIEAESRFRDRRTRSLAGSSSRRLRPPALLATALVVAVAVGALTSSQWLPGSGGDAGSSIEVALASATATQVPGPTLPPGATPIPAPRQFAYVDVDPNGELRVKIRNVDEVCPADSKEPCGSDAVVQDRDLDLTLDQDATSVFASRDNTRFIVVNDPTSDSTGTVSVVSVASHPPTATPTPTTTPSPATASPASAPPPTAPPPTARPTVTPPPSIRPAKTPIVTPSPPSTASPPPSEVAPTPTPTASVTVTPTPGGPIEIAHDVTLVGQSAAYSASGEWFAFTARASDGSGGPDIFVWKVGDGEANRITSDHRSAFGSWIGDVIVGSTVVEGGDGNAPDELVPASFLLDPATAVVTSLPQTGKAWRPAVDARGQRAVYWAGSVRTTEAGYAPDKGRLVLGDWGTGDAAPSDGPLPTPITGDQGALRHETTIAAGRMDDWDARWDSTGTHLAVWIADPQNPSVGRLSLYAVDSFDGRIDVKKPLLDAEIAAAGYSISDGKLVWAQPDASGSPQDRTIQLLAWTDDAVGTVTTDGGKVIVIR